MPALLTPPGEQIDLSEMPSLEHDLICDWDPCDRAAKWRHTIAHADDGDHVMTRLLCEPHHQHMVSLYENRQSDWLCQEHIATLAQTWTRLD